MRDAFQVAIPHPLLEATVAGLVRRVLVRQFAPLRSCAQNPQDFVNHGSRILPRAPATIGSLFRSQNGFDQFLLGIAEVNHFVGLVAVSTPRISLEKAAGSS